jgi:hypothetical protein
MKVSGRKVERYMQSAMMDMYANNRTRIRCPCTRCKEGVLLDPVDGGSLKAHLLMYGFMDGYTRWISEDDDDAAVHMAGHNDRGLDEEMTDRHKDDGTGHGAGKSPKMTAAEKIPDTAKKSPDMAEKRWRSRRSLRRY